MTREELIEVMARAILQDFEDGADMSTHPVPERAASRNARAALAAIEAAGVRLVPVKCTADMAGYAGARAEARGDIRMLPGEYRAAWEAMLSASPYAALKEPDQ